MSRQLKLFPLLLLAFPAYAADSGDSSSLVIGGAAVLVVACAVLVAFRRAWGVSAGALLGIVIAGYLTAHHTGSAESICNVSDVWSCDAVNRSVYSEIAGVPIALLGVAFYAVMAWLGLRVTSGGAKGAPAVMTLLAVLAVAYDLFLAWASTSLGAFCPLCVASWTLNLVLLVGSALLWRAEGTVSGPGLLEGLKAEVGSVAVVGLATLVLGGMASRDSSAAATAGVGGGGTGSLVAYYEQAGGRIELDGTEPATGDPGAPYTLVEWADFECPHCAIMSEELKKLLAENKDVRLLYKHYPISGACNSFVEGERHKYACNAAAASECARLQGRFWELSRQMFKNQEFLGKEDIRFMAEQNQLDIPSFEACMADPATAEAIKQDVAAGGVAGVQGTPSVFLKGPFGDQWVRVIGGRDAINAILAAARAGTPLPPPPPPSER